MSPAEEAYRLGLAELLRMRAMGEVRAFEDEEAIHDRLEPLWRKLSPGERKTINADVARIVRHRR